MKRIFISMLVLLTPALALAGHTVEERLEMLEEKQAELYHTLAEKKEAGLASAIAEKITLSGLVEVEAVLEDVENTDGTSVTESDIALATAQLGVGAAVAEGVNADIVMLFEDGEDFTVDEAVIGFENDVFFGTVGLQYVPFGVYHSHFISDPLTLELGESQETAVLGGYGTDLVSLSAYLFNGDAEKAGDDESIRDWGVALDVTPAEGLALGASYISDLADSDAELLGGVDYADRVGGYSAYVAYATGNFDFTGEVLGAATDFDAADLDFDNDG
ncbi:MAG: LbtU family siderophore porin, partial [Desulfuromonadales bacterium]|nr:LbtU family siderophore porin [Desulfuromonadales bacterium]NIR33521.1 LbtU family siderophore porin [Desulfuromonadales bacterium]NIS39695.1 LbtU family siderophore porin [Desulfuromonadales bacterium]